ncbi:MAG: DUF420 domain-containing protein [Planctomycetes bacterium]|nr:DUF420 domain-containing protein [Planctomycetota bacterium]
MLAAFDFRILATVDAVLNGLALVLIVAGLIAIKRGKTELHKKLMLTAVGVSAAFLACYLVYHANAEPVKYQGEGAMRKVYFALLISHVVLAALQVPLIATTVVLGLKDRRAKHRKWAKITAPIWLYVSVTGVVVYFMLY